MKRGVIKLTNLESSALREALISQGFTNNDILFKLEPVENLDPKQDFLLEISEEDAESILDNLSISNKQVDQNFSKARSKVQDFLAKSRYL